MIEAVENHMPEVIVIDEIGTEAEALAARIIAERGVQPHRHRPLRPQRRWAIRHRPADAGRRALRARNSFRQPDYYSLDLRVSKDFALGPGDQLFFGECFNCNDAANRGTSNTVWSTGPTANATFGALNLVGTPRTFQLALRYDF
jgi:hypothetical protein